MPRATNCVSHLGTKDKWTPQGFLEILAVVGTPRDKVRISEDLGVFCKYSTRPIRRSSGLSSLAAYPPRVVYFVSTLRSYTT